MDKTFNVWGHRSGDARNPAFSSAGIMGIEVQINEENSMLGKPRRFSSHPSSCFFFLTRGESRASSEALHIRSRTRKKKKRRSAFEVASAAPRRDNCQRVRGKGGPKDKLGRISGPCPPLGGKGWRRPPRVAAPHPWGWWGWFVAAWARSGPPMGRWGGGVPRHARLLQFFPPPTPHPLSLRRFCLFPATNQPEVEKEGRTGTD